MRPREFLAGSPLAGFFAKGVLWLVVLTALWAPLADWTMRPAATVATIALQTIFPWWVRGGTYRDDTLEVGTRIRIEVADAPRGARAELIAETKPSHFGFGLPMLIALLLASGSRRPLRKLFIGIAALIPCQAFSIFFAVLKQAALGSGLAATVQLGFSPWQLNAIALCYQLGVLLVPTLAPILLWLLLEPGFLSALIFEGQLRRETENLQ